MIILVVQFYNRLKNLGKYWCAEGTVGDRRKEKSGKEFACLARFVVPVVQPLKGSC
jgi:hypothetical protein